jgi:hypothetical protein
MLAVLARGRGSSASNASEMLAVLARGRGSSASNASEMLAVLARGRGSSRGQGPIQVHTLSCVQVPTPPAHV